ncbi:LysR substrate-binding domain protein [Bacteriovorax sp. BSW11_IV]|uniref:LysR family transcriptional regulator n=1 Tax=Bacteriovorax sp. BSW11_IV TaxID=1353529 RepID=UPI000389F266|nr:LysR family transcriptional regulator [Bacteriovorax sp. BSW11_IV]EQC50192.1 LysR substrate-binding domain protein [Bacteriovorax sp. BSW11_IV]
METIKGFGHTYVFVKVAQYLSYSKAAKELGVSKAHLSKSIQQLENEIGQKLLNRSTRLVKLTLEGEKFFETCLEAVSAIENAKNNIKESINYPQGLLRITAAGAFAEEYLTPVASSLLAKYPKLKIELSFSEKIVNLVEENFDMAIRVGHLVDSSMIAKRISTRKEYICATKKYLSKNGTPKTPNELKDHNCLAGNNGQWVFKEKTKQYSIKINGNFTSNNARALLNAALQNTGIVRLPEVYVRSYIDSKKLVPILTNYMTTEVPIWAIYPSTKKKSTNVAFFLEELEQSLSNK